MKTYCTETRSYFTLYGEDFPLEVFTEEMGISPTKAYRQGEKYIRVTTKHTHFETAWDLRIDDVLTDHPEEVIETLVDKLHNSVDIINSYKESYKLQCKLVAVINFKTAQTQGLLISPKLVAFANKVGAPFEFDIYNESGEHSI
ncbi:hypothetical protein CF394_11350 [Tetzosporium hominis]|uniref:DUF4279 domain-containing protein n=1 Tax=Tetzosporium hominis TaxID=2020506 RepID=A0A264W1J0_9BACL|nr:DUF4279 domain-containing protein [Tetzosporium hominis]OZS77431.1 hypothetical protein CF394_11350 [Tetzosporium hominis]